MQDEEERESIPLEDVPKEPAPIVLLAPEQSMRLKEAVECIKSGTAQVRQWITTSHDWELMEPTPVGGDILAFAHRHDRAVHRVAGRLRVPAHFVIARLKDHCAETRIQWDPDITAVQCVESYGDNMERVQSTFRMPAGLSDGVLEGIQHTLYMEESRTYLYVFASIPTGRATDIEAIVGASVRELDGDTDCELNVVFSVHWQTHWSVGWLLDPLLEAHFFNAERMVERALLYEKK